MLLPRITPVLLLSGTDLVKTTSFSRRTYVGDPLNVVQIFNDLNVDELVLFDIDASVLGVEPNYSLRENCNCFSHAPMLWRRDKKCFPV